MATLTDKEIIEDYERFVRHEAMRANTSQGHVGSLIADGAIHQKGMQNARMSRAALEEMLRANGYRKKDLFLVCKSDAGETYFVPRERK